MTQARLMLEEHGSPHLLMLVKISQGTRTGILSPLIGHDHSIGLVEVMMPEGREEPRQNVQERENRT